MTDNRGAMADPEPPKKTIYEQQTRSSRRLTPMRRFLYRLAAPVAIAIVRLWWRMVRVVEVTGRERFEQAVARHGVVIPIYWHAQQLLPLEFLLGCRGLGLKLGFLISPSVDGELPAMLVRKVGGVAIRGSSNTTGARALRDYYEAIAKQGVSPSMTPDGPRGPRRQCKPGPVLVSQLSGKPIVPMAYAASRVWLFRTWDRHVLPWPFSRAVLAIGEPVIVPKGLDAAGLQRWQDELTATLDRLFEEARDTLRRHANPVVST
jgi:lysophospholipid acyltransferase (LPLAT)-like uncharacterized protein